MRSTTRPTSRTTARIITPATWRWCARISPKSRSCWPRRRRRSRPRSMRARAATSASRCRRGSAASTCRISRRSICGAKPPPRGRFISPRLAEQIQIAIERREQALLFLNRRGYAPLTLCRACGHRFACTICDAWLVDHRFRQRLVCHHCGFSMPRPHVCPHCAAEESLVAVGPGVERLQEEAAQLFPDARTMVLSSDLITSIETMRSELNEIAEGRVDIIIGTQLVAKGHHFPAAQSGRRGRCRSRPRQWRSARRRADVSTAQPGDRPRRPRAGPRHRLSADPSARASRDEGAGRAATARRFTPARSRRASAPAIRRSAGSPA